MKKQLVILGIIAILVTVGLSGCSSENNNQNPEKMKFVGSWQYTVENSSSVLDIFSNGTFIASDLFYGSWDLKNEKFIMEMPDYGYTFEYDYTFSNDNRTLTLVYSDGRTQVYAKQ